MNFIVTIVDPSFRKSKKVTAAPASTFAHVVTQYTTYAESLLHEESLAILLLTDFCHCGLERAVSPGRDSCRGQGDGGPFHMGGTGAVPRHMNMDVDKPPAPPGWSPSSVTAATPPAEPSRWVISHQQTRGCLQPVPK